MVALKDGFTAWRQSQNEVRNITFVWLNMMSGRGANPIPFNIKNKDWTSRTLANPPTLYVRQHLIFVFVLRPTRILKVTSYVYHPLEWIV